MQVVGEAQGALEAWRKHGDALPWARWLADLRGRLDDPNGWSNEYQRVALGELASSELTAQDIGELARESRTILAGLLQHSPWPVPSMWWSDQIRGGKRDGTHHVAMQLALGADNERPNGARLAATALAILQEIHDVNTLYYADHDLPMDAAAITGTHEIRDLLTKIETLAATDAALSTDLLRSVGETVEIPESVLEENRRLRHEVRELRARVDSVQVQLLEVATLAEESRAEDFGTGYPGSEDEE